MLLIRNNISIEEELSEIMEKVSNCHDNKKIKKQYDILGKDEDCAAVWMKVLKTIK